MHSEETKDENSHNSTTIYEQEKNNMNKDHKETGVKKRPWVVGF